jgi:DNA-binding GntR family transcriptional regulator
MVEHERIVKAIEMGDGDAADLALREHISQAFTIRLRLDAEAVQAGR